MCGRNKMNVHFIISAVSLTVFPISFLFMPIANSDSFSYARYATVSTGIVFWMSGLLGYGILIYLYLTKKKTKKTQRKFYIFSNSIVSVADIVFVLGILGMITLCLIGMSSTYMGYLCLFIIVFSLNTHLLYSRKYIREQSYK